MAGLFCERLETRCQCGGCNRHFAHWMGGGAEPGAAAELGDRGAGLRDGGAARPAPGGGREACHLAPRALPAGAPRSRFLRSRDRDSSRARARPGRGGRGVAGLDRAVRRLRWPRHSDRDEEHGIRAPVPEPGAHPDGGGGPDHPGPYGGGRDEIVRRPVERAMSETLVMQTDLDRLAERVEKAAALIQQLREDRGRLEGERNLLSERVRELEQKLQGQDVPALIQEVSALRRVQRDWENERRDVASRVESLVK